MACHWSVHAGADGRFFIFVQKTLQFNKIIYIFNS